VSRENVAKGRADSRENVAKRHADSREDVAKHNSPSRHKDLKRRSPSREKEVTKHRSESRGEEVKRRNDTDLRENLDKHHSKSRGNVTKRRSTSREKVSKSRHDKMSTDPPKPVVTQQPKKYQNITVTRGIEAAEVRMEGEVENLPIFRGPELDPVSRKEFKKIQVTKLTLFKTFLYDKTGRVPYS
jgi:hypothetical protein